MLHPDVPWLAKGYSKVVNSGIYNREKFETDDSFLLCPDDYSEDEDALSVINIKEGIKKTHSAIRQRAKSAGPHRTQQLLVTSRPKSAKPSTVNRTQGGKRTSRPATANSIRLSNARRRIKSASSTSVRSSYVTDMNTDFVAREGQKRERMYYLRPPPHPDVHFMDRHARCHDNNHIHEPLLSFRPRRICGRCGDDSRCNLCCSFRPTSAAVLAGFPADKTFTEYDQYRPQSAPYSSKDFSAVPKHNNVVRGIQPHFCNFVSSIAMHERTPSPIQYRDENFKHRDGFRPSPPIKRPATPKKKRLTRKRTLDPYPNARNLLKYLIDMNLMKPFLKEYKERQKSTHVESSRGDMPSILKHIEIPEDIQEMLILDQGQEKPAMDRKSLLEQYLKDYGEQLSPRGLEKAIDYNWLLDRYLKEYSEQPMVEGQRTSDSQPTDKGQSMADLITSIFKDSGTDITCYDEDLVMRLSDSPRELSKQALDSESRQSLPKHVGKDIVKEMEQKDRHTKSVGGDAELPKLHETYRASTPKVGQVLPQTMEPIHQDTRRPPQEVISFKQKSQTQKSVLPDVADHPKQVGTPKSTTSDNTIPFEKEIMAAPYSRKAERPCICPSHSQKVQIHKSVLPNVGEQPRLVEESEPQKRHGIASFIPRKVDETSATSRHFQKKQVQKSVLHDIDDYPESDLNLPHFDEKKPASIISRKSDGTSASSRHSQGQKPRYPDRMKVASPEEPTVLTRDVTSPYSRESSYDSKIPPGQYRQGYPRQVTASYELLSDFTTLHGQSDQISPEPSRLRSRSDPKSPSRSVSPGQPRCGEPLVYSRQSQFSKETMPSQRPRRVSEIKYADEGGASPWGVLKDVQLPKMEEFSKGQMSRRRSTPRGSIHHNSPEKTEVPMPKIEDRRLTITMNEKRDFTRVPRQPSRPSVSPLPTPPRSRSPSPQRVEEAVVIKSVQPERIPEEVVEIVKKQDVPEKPSSPAPIVIPRSVRPATPPVSPPRSPPLSPPITAWTDQVSERSWTASPEPLVRPLSPVARPPSPARRTVTPPPPRPRSPKPVERPAPPERRPSVKKEKKKKTPIKMEPEPLPPSPPRVETPVVQEPVPVTPVPQTPPPPIITLPPSEPEYVEKEKEKEPIKPEVKEEEKPIEPPAKNMYGMDKKDILEREMMARRWGINLEQDDKPVEVEMPKVPKKLQQWLQSRLALSKRSSRFELPMDMRLLETMDPKDYLRKYCIISSRRHMLYQKFFMKNKDRCGKLLYKDLERALKDVLTSTLDKEKMELLFSYCGITTDSQVDYRLYCGISAFAERLLYGNYVTEDTAELGEYQKEKIECADFCALDWKFHGVNVNKQMQKLLRVL